MTIHQNTTPQIVGLAACGAAAIGLSLDEALTMQPSDLRNMLAAAGLTEPATPPAAVLPTQHTAATIPGEEVHPDGSLRLDALTGSEPEPAAPAADFFADLD